MDLYTTRNDLASNAKTVAIALLNARLADGIDLALLTKQAHWNVKGIQFIQLHELFDKLATEVLDYVDTIAERATALGGTALGTARMSAESSRLPEYPEVVGSVESVQALVDRYAILAASSRAAIDSATEFGDVDTADVFTGISRGLDKSLWFLEAHLQD